MKRKRRNGFFIFQSFIIGVVIVVVASIVSGVIYEEELARAQYRPGISVIGVSGGTLPQEVFSEIEERGGMLTQFLAEDRREGYMLLGASPQYLETMQPTLRAGRYFTLLDQDSLVCLVSENIAKTLYGTIQQSLGQKISLPTLEAELTIVGVLEDNQELPVQTTNSLGIRQREFNVSSDALVLFPVSAFPLPAWADLSTSIWISGTVHDAVQLKSYLESLRLSLDFIVNPLPQQMLEGQTQQDLLIVLLIGFALLTMCVSGLGMFGMQMIHVLRRRQEMGLRTAVGAVPGSIMLLILGETVRTTLGPGLLGAAVALALQPLLRNTLPLPMLINGGILFVCLGTLTLFTVLVGLYPAWHGARLDPIESLGKSPRIG